MNLSQRIRSHLSSPKTAADVHSIIGGDLSLIRGCIQTMVRVGILDRTGDKKPYRYKVARCLKEQNRGFNLTEISFAQKVRDVLKSGRMSDVEVALRLESTRRKVGDTIREGADKGFILAHPDKTYSFLRDPVKKIPISHEERNRRKAEHNRLKRAKKSSPIEPKPIQPCQTVDEWVAAGGVIDRSSTKPKFERLTHEDIISSNINPVSTYARAGRSYLSS